MPTTRYTSVAASLTMFAVPHFALRALVAALRPLQDFALVGFLDRRMPARRHRHPHHVHVRSVSLQAAPHGLPEATAVAATLALHFWKRNALASIIGGTAVYVLLVNVVLA